MLTKHILTCSVRPSELAVETARVRALQSFQLSLSAEASHVIFAIDPSTVM